MDARHKNATRRKASFGATLKTVLWSFIGIRKKHDHVQDAAELNPIHVLIAGILVAAVFIAMLLAIVHIAVGH